MRRRRTDERQTQPARPSLGAPRTEHRSGANADVSTRPVVRLQPSVPWRRRRGMPLVPTTGGPGSEASGLRPRRPRRRHGVVDGVRATRSAPTRWTFDNYRTALDAEGLRERLPEQPRGHRSPRRSSRSPSPPSPRTRSAWMEFRGRYIPVRGGRRAPRGSLADVADSDPARCTSRGASIGPLQIVSGPRPQRHVPRGLARSHRRSDCRSRCTCWANYIALAAVVDQYESSQGSTAPITSPSSERLVVPLSVPALAAFAIFQFLWVWNDLPRRATSSSAVHGGGTPS